MFPTLFKVTSSDHDEFTLLLTPFIVDDSIDEQYLLNNIKSLKKSKLPLVAKKVNQAKSSKDRQQKLEIMKNKHTSKKSKPSERTIQKRQQKQLKKNKVFKKKLVSIAKSAKNEKIKEEKSNEDNKEDVKAAVVYNEEGKMGFPKFEFAAQKSKAKKSKKDKVQTNPKIILQTIKKQKKEIQELKEQGEEEKAKQITSDLAWKKAFDKVEGKKVNQLTILYFVLSVTQSIIYLYRSKMIQLCYIRLSSVERLKRKSPSQVGKNGNRK